MSDSQTTTMTVSGMTCKHCISAVTLELMHLPGVQAVRIDLVEGGDSPVEVDSSELLRPEEITAAVDEAGYTATF